MDLLENEIVSITWWRRKHDDDRNEPVLEETHERCVQWFIACPEPGEGEDALTADFLNHCDMIRLEISTEKSNIHRPWEKITLNTFPKAESATKTERARSALLPNIFRKKVAATIRPELMMSALGTAAKYAIWRWSIKNLCGGRGGLR